MKTIAYYLSKILITLALIVTGCSENGRFTLVGGETQSLDDYKGQWLVVNFWAEWCSPCREEIPELNRLNEFGKSNNISVIGVSYDAVSSNQLKEIINKWAFKYPVMETNPVPILPFELPRKLPANYLIDPTGQLSSVLFEKQDYKSIIEAIEKAKTAQ